MSAVTPTPHPLLQECADAISKVYFWDRHHSLRCAIDGRLALTTGLSEHLSESFHNAAVHGGELDLQPVSRHVAATPRTSGPRCPV